MLGGDVGVLFGVRSGLGGGIHTPFGEPQQADDDEDRTADQQDLVPTALMGEQDRSGSDRQRIRHVDRSYGLGD